MSERHRERYELSWPGKARAQAQASAPCHKRLVELSEGARAAADLVIQGDNLEALKLLRPGYAGRVKLIYIDPPYNTGSELVYADQFYRRDHADEGARRHAAWLDMMYARLLVAAPLLREDGVLMCSVDDREVAQLRLLIDEVLGEGAFITQLVWHAKRGGGGDVKTLVSEHEHILVAGGPRARSALGRRALASQALDRCDARGPYRKGRELNKWGAGSARADRPTMFFPIPGPDGRPVYPIRNDGSEGRWRLGEPALLARVESGDVIFEPRGDGTFVVYEKVRSAAPRPRAFRSMLADVGSAADGTRELKELFDGRAPFDFPKPTALVRRLIQIAGAAADDLVLDFFAGSGSTGHAVWAHNASSGDRLRFLLVEQEQPLGQGRASALLRVLCRELGRPATIAELTKERLRRAAARLSSASVAGGGEPVLGVRCLAVREPSDG